MIQRVVSLLREYDSYRVLRQDSTPRPIFCRGRFWFGVSAKMCCILISTLCSNVAAQAFLHACFKVLFKDSSTHVANWVGLPKYFVENKRWKVIWCIGTKMSYGCIRAMCFT